MGFRLNLPLAVIMMFVYGGTALGEFWCCLNNFACFIIYMGLISTWAIEGEKQSSYTSVWLMSNGPIRYKGAHHTMLSAWVPARDVT